MVGRYEVHQRIAAGGMASVHLGRLHGPAGFQRTVAIKRLHPQYQADPEFVSMLLDEARIAGRLRHANVVQTLDVVSAEGELLLVMEYVEGESLARLLRDTIRRHDGPPPAAIVVAVVCDLLRGLEAAHEASGESGQPLGIVHRDVSPQNVLVGVDGVGRVLDFGVAKAIGRAQATRAGQLKGKLPYMAPEQIQGGEVSRRTDVYAAAVVLWEGLTGQRLFSGDEGTILAAVTRGDVARPSVVEPGVPSALDAVVMRGLERDPAARFHTAREMAEALEAACAPAGRQQVSQWVVDTCGASLAERAALVTSLESSTAVEVPAFRAAAMRGRRRALFTLLAVAALAVAVVVTARVVGRGPEGPAAPGVSAPSSPSASPSAALAQASSPPATSPSSSGSVASPGVSSSAKRPRLAPGPDLRCAPPYYFKDGIKMYKAGCVH